MKAKTVAAGAGVKQTLRLEWIAAGSLDANPLNWRRHPPQQLEALKDMLADSEVGWAGACLFNERTGRLIDGHARKSVADPATPIPVLVGNWSEEAEKKILLTLDPMGAMATGDLNAFKALMEQVNSDSMAVRDMLMETEHALAGSLDEEEAEEAEEPPPIMEMELHPFEHYDYVVVLARDVRDWQRLMELLEVPERVNSSPIPGKQKIGIGRAVDAKKLIEKLEAKREV